MRPNFLVIGAMKSATTTLWEGLRSHPQIFMPSRKEAWFFSRDDIFAEGWGWYEALFSEANAELAIGEASTCYTKQKTYPKAAPRIAEHLPEAKLIYIVRHPLERIESHWRHFLLRSHTVTFDDLVRTSDAIDVSCYWRQISAYRDHFSDDRILVVFFDDLIKDPGEVFERCFRFLGVDPSLTSVDPELAMHVSNTRRVDGQLIRLARKLPGFKSAKRAMPRISKTIGNTLRSPMPDHPAWSAELRRQVVDQIRDDTALFLRHYGKPADWWQLD